MIWRSHGRLKLSKLNLVNTRMYMIFVGDANFIYVEFCNSLDSDRLKSRFCSVSDKIYYLQLNVVSSISQQQQSQQ